jgi:hypothetical protein
MIREATLTRPRPRLHRLGDATAVDISTGAKIATTGLSTIAGAAGAGLITLSGTLAAAVPIAGAVIAVGVLVFSFLHNTRGLQQDAETTSIVNQAQTLMQQNLAAWRASNKSLATQAQAQKNFDDLWSQVTTFCGNPNEGSPGQRCISERTRGGIYDYFAAYRDTITNDPQAGAVDAAAAAALASSPAAPAVIVNSSGQIITQPTATPEWLLPAAAIAAALVFLS